MPYQLAAGCSGLNDLEFNLRKFLSCVESLWYPYLQIIFLFMEEQYRMSRYYALKLIGISFTEKRKKNTLATYS